MHSLILQSIAFMCPCMPLNLTVNEEIPFSRPTHSSSQPLLVSLAYSTRALLCTWRIRRMVCLYVERFVWEKRTTDPSHQRTHFPICPTTWTNIRTYLCNSVCVCVMGNSFVYLCSLYESDCIHSHTQMHIFIFIAVIATIAIWTHTHMHSQWYR